MSDNRWRDIEDRRQGDLVQKFLEEHKRIGLGGSPPITPTKDKKAARTFGYILIASILSFIILGLVVDASESYGAPAIPMMCLVPVILVTFLGWAANKW